MGVGGALVMKKGLGPGSFCRAERSLEGPKRHGVEPLGRGDWPQAATQGTLGRLSL